MNKRWFDAIIVFTVIFLVPMLILLVTSSLASPDRDASIPPEFGTTEMQTIEQTENTQRKEVAMINVMLANKRTENMLLRDYVVGVLLAEMPADFHTEALKAQAIVARTYALKKVMFNNKHPMAVCTDPSCCQGYLSQEAYRSDKGTLKDIERIEQAVEETMNLVLVHNGKLIEATYFSCSGGMTEDAAAVWGEDIPYLQATKSPGEENAARYTETVKFSIEEFEKRLGTSFSGGPDTWINNVTYTNGGGVDTITIGGKQYTGTEVREKLGLRSTIFTITIIGTSAVITTKGFGHRVGLSQYGAEAMAVQGATFDKILQHYYSGTELMMYEG